MAGYLPDEATAGAFADGWYRTGDVGWLEPEGWVHLTDRCKEMIKVSGFQVAPAEIEAVLHGHPAVVDCAVFGVPDERAGEVPVAAVQLEPGSDVTAEDLEGLVADSLATYKRLRQSSWSTPSHARRRARCCAARCVTSGRRVLADRAVRADGRPPLPRAGRARDRRPRWSTASACTPSPGSTTRSAAKLDAAVDGRVARVAHGRGDGRRTAGLGGRGRRRGRGARAGLADAPSSGPPWLPSCGDSPGRRPPRARDGRAPRRTSQAWLSPADVSTIGRRGPRRLDGVAGAGARPTGPAA